MDENPIGVVVFFLMMLVSCGLFAYIVDCIKKEK